ncbi:MAG: Amuc_1100 family pilus-like protein [Opitutales bacterium]|nr:Amuc_1100 family pilus-like protein [Opitutales bacterium]
MLSCNQAENLDEVIGDIESLDRDLAKEIDDGAGFGWIEANLDLAREDNKNLLDKRARELKKWREILGRDDVFAGVEKKATDDVNAEISRFLDLYRKEAGEYGVKIKGALKTNTGESKGLFPSEEISSGEDREGFGFAGYDGSWPSISDKEARELLKQKLISEKLLLTLFKAKQNGEPMELLGIRREPVGDVDRQRIAEEALNVDSLANVLAKREGSIETYAFEVTFLARTSALRTFLNSLQYPFLVRDISVSRLENSSSGFTATNNSSSNSPFGPNSDNIAVNSKTLPIIKDVGSRFSILVEYVLVVHADLDLLKPLCSSNLLAECTLAIDDIEEGSETDEKLKAFLRRHYPWNPPPSSSISELLTVLGSEKDAKYFLKQISGNK